MMCWRLWVCTTVPWLHGRWRVVWRLSDASELCRCRCGRLWAMNHAAQVVLPWALVQPFYASRWWN
jgi:hypothetical protein